MAAPFLQCIRAYRLYLYNPSGTPFTYCDLAATPTFCEFTPNVTGTWKAVLDPQAAAIGSTTLSLASDQAKGLLIPGVPVSTSVAAKGQNATYTFAGTSGHLATFDVTASSWSTGSALLYFYAPTGATLYNWCRVDTTSFCAFTPNVTGTWRVTLDPQANSVGSATFFKE